MPARVGDDAPRRALITGLTGQDGSFLAELLLEKGYAVTGVVRGWPHASLGACEHLRGRVGALPGELLDHASLRAAVQEVRPHELYHLAAPSFVPASWERLAETCAAIVDATAALLEAVREIDPATRVFVAGTGAIFGAAGECPQREDTPCRPESPYAIAKLAVHQLVGALRAHEGMYVCSGILYNHESERRPQRFVTRKLTRAAARVALGLADEVEVGDLRAVRDWSFAGDIARGAWLMLQREQPEDYILASGVPHTVAEWARAAFACVDRSFEDHVRVAPELVRAPEVTSMVGDPSRAQERLGWRAEVSFERLVERMVRADLEELGS
ncbi:MAG TPA: GDP-mannose 4,6-dehydratase [Solirubrobacteraceae bacterium]|jgi:GDPmannose 4,6-dehydratase|nr:GDP-mannose 4,6-dehydratase [Solirubrobacteraceae bacterium]